MRNAYLSIAALVTLGAMGFNGCDSAQAEEEQIRSLAQSALQQAELALQSGDVAGAEAILERSIAAVPDRPYRNDVIAPLAQRLAEIRAQTNAPAPQPEAPPEPAPAAQAPPEEPSPQATQAPPEVPQPAYVPVPQDLQQGELSPQSIALERSLQESAAAAADAQRRQRFMELHDHGLDAYERQDYPGAVTLLQEALKLQDDADTYDLLQRAIERASKPRLAVVDFSVAGDVGVRDAGRVVPELLLPRFGQERFELIERAYLQQILAEQDMQLSTLTAGGGWVGERKLKSVRYLVVGSVLRLQQLVVSARLVDVASGQIVQTAEVTIDSLDELGDALTDLALMLQMNEEEKRAFLERRRLAEVYRTQLAYELGEQEWARRQAQLQLDRQRQAQALEAWREHNRLALAVLMDVRKLMARGDFERALRLSRAAMRDFADTAVAYELAELHDQAHRELAYIREAEARRVAREQFRREMEARYRHEQFLRFQEAGLDAMRRGDIATAIAALSRALDEEYDPRTHLMLEQLTTRNAPPGVALCGLDVPNDPMLTGMGDELGGLLINGFAGSYRVVYERTEIVRVMRERRISVADLWDRPTLVRELKITTVRYIVVARVIRTASYNVEARMIDVQTGQIVQTSELHAADARQLGVTMGETARVLQMNRQDKQAYVQRMEQYPRLMQSGRAAAQRGQWQEALDSYNQAFRVRPSDEAKQAVAQAAARVAQTQDVQTRHDRALEAAKRSLNAGDLPAAQAQAQLALNLQPQSAQARQVLENALPTLVVRARLDGQEHRGAQVWVNGQLRPERTPATIKLPPGSRQEITVTLPAAGGKTYTISRQNVAVTWSGSRDLLADISTVTPQAAAPAPTTTGRPTGTTPPVISPPAGTRAPTGTALPRLTPTGTSRPVAPPATAPVPPAPTTTGRPTGTAPPVTSPPAGTRAPTGTALPRLTPTGTPRPVAPPATAPVPPAPTTTGRPTGTAPPVIAPPAGTPRPIAPPATAPVPPAPTTTGRPTGTTPPVIAPPAGTRAPTGTALPRLTPAGTPRPVAPPATAPVPPAPTTTGRPTGTTPPVISPPAGTRAPTGTALPRLTPAGPAAPPVATRPAPSGTATATAPAGTARPSGTGELVAPTSPGAAQPTAAPQGRPRPAAPPVITKPQPAGAPQTGPAPTGTRAPGAPAAGKQPVPLPTPPAADKPVPLPAAPAPSRPVTPLPTPRASSTNERPTTGPASRPATQESEND
jgi:hypothetical protein